MGQMPDHRAARGLLAEAGRLDAAVYAAIARTPSPTLDRAMRALSRAADHSKLNLLAAGLLSAGGGRNGRRAARAGVVAVAATATVVNVSIKPLTRRRRPDRALHRVPEVRHVAMPRSRSLPSGHAAAAFAFATGVGQVTPRAAIPLRVLATLVGYSRVHTGVHYPGDVVIGALVGTTIAQATAGRFDV
jgi:membrane-associated phospholipid phosphatase